MVILPERMKISSVILAQGSGKPLGGLLGRPEIFLTPSRDDPRLGDASPGECIIKGGREIPRQV